MPRLNPIDPAAATGKAKELLAAVKAKLGITPNMMKTMANSPAVLSAYLAFNTALSEGSLDAKMRERIALVVGEQNHCDYCVSAHSLLGKKAGLSDLDLTASRDAASTDRKTEAGLKFARLLVETRGEASDSQLKTLRAAGWSEGEIAELVAHVGLNIFTNYFNHVAQTEVDFPRVPALV